MEVKGFVESFANFHCSPNDGDGAHMAYLSQNQECRVSFRAASGFICDVRNDSDWLQRDNASSAAATSYLGPLVPTPFRALKTHWDFLSQGAKKPQMPKAQKPRIPAKYYRTLAIPFSRFYLDFANMSGSS